jgi:hypothetical protein
MLESQKYNGRESLRDFLEELVLLIEEPEQIELIIEILNEIKSMPDRPAAAGLQRYTNTEGRADRYDILKKYPHRIARIGFVKGEENARRVLPSLRSLGDSIYFLYVSRGSPQPFIALIE